MASEKICVSKGTQTVDETKVMDNDQINKEIAEAIYNKKLAQLAITKNQKIVKNCDVDLQYLHSMKDLSSGKVVKVMLETQEWLQECGATCVRIWNPKQGGDMWIYNLVKQKLTLYNAQGMQQMPFAFDKKWVGFNMQLFDA